MLTFHLVVLVGSVLASVAEQLDVCCQTDRTHLHCWNISEFALGSEICENSSSYTCYKMERTEDVSLAEFRKRELHIGALVPVLKTDPGGAFVAMKFATDIINNRTDILAGYKLILHREDIHLVSVALLYVN